MTQRRPHRLGAVAIAVLLIGACTDKGPTEVLPSHAPAPQSLSAIDVAGLGRQAGVMRARPSSSHIGLDEAPYPSPAGAMTSHSSSTLNYTHTFAIFWGTPWNVDPQFTGDKITTLQSFFSDFGGSSYANILTEYGVSTSSTFQGSFVDNSAAPSGDPGSIGLGAEVCRVLDSNGLTPDYYAVYSVFTTALPPVMNSQGDVKLGYHTTSTCHSSLIHVAVIFNMDGEDRVTDGVQHSSNAAALANTAAHELAETITDASPGGGWFASNIGGEVGDKCDFSFAPGPNQYVTLLNGGVFKLQGEWSNAAFATGTGFANANNELGCITSAGPAFSASISGSSRIPPGGTCQYYASASGGSGSYTYAWTWTTSGGASAGGYSPSNGTFILAAQDSYGTINLSVTAVDAAHGQGSATTSVTIDPSSYCT